MISFLKKYKKEFIAIIVMVLMPCIIYGATEKGFMRERAMERLSKEISEHKRGSYDGQKFVTVCYPIMKDIVLIGDSYAHFLCFDLGFDLTDYSCPGLTLDDLRPVFDAAVKSKKKYAVVFIGPNDFIAKTPVDYFKKRLHEYVKLIREEMGAKVILSTYMHSIFTDNVEKEDKSYYRIDDYNKALMELIDEKNGVYYLDISMLDDKEKYSRMYENDKLHFNFDFNVAYVNKLYDLLIKIKEDEIKEDCG